MRVRSESGITIVPKMVDFGRGSFKIRPSSSICIKIETNSWSFTSTGEKNRYFIDSNIIYGSLGKPDTRAQILRNAVALSWSEMIYYRYWFDWNGLQQANKRTMSTRNSLRIIFNERKLVDLIAVFQKVLELNESAVLSSIRTSIECIVMLCVPNRHLKTSEEREKKHHTQISTHQKLICIAVIGTSIRWTHRITNGIVSVLRFDRFGYFSSPNVQVHIDR